MRDIKPKDRVEHLLLDKHRKRPPLHRALFNGLPSRRQHFGNITRLLCPQACKSIPQANIRIMPDETCRLDQR